MTPRTAGPVEDRKMRCVAFLLAIAGFALNGTANAATAIPPILYNVDFEAFTAGSPLPAPNGGTDRPSSVDSNLTATVQNATTVPSGVPAVTNSKFLRLQESCGEAPDLSFDNGIALTGGKAHVGLDLLFENFDSYHVYFRNGSGSGLPPASQVVADILFVPGTAAGVGNMQLSSAGGTTSVAFQAGVPIRLDAYFDLDTNQWYVDVNGNRVVNGTAILDSALGFVAIGFEFSCATGGSGPTGGVMQFDNFLFEAVDTIPGTTSPPSIATVANGIARPFAVAVHNGFAYVPDPGTQTVWQVDLSTGAKVAVAGTGEQGYNGDGLAATLAQLDTPTGVAVDQDGALYIADSGNHAIRKVATPGVDGALITTVAGIPTMYAVGESTPQQCLNPPPNFDTSQCTQATSLRLFGPRSVAVDSQGNLLIADRMNQQIKKLYKATGYLVVVAGRAGFTGSNDGTDGTCIIDCSPASFNSPVGVAVDSTGVVYVADEGNNAIRSISAGQVSTVPAGTLLRPTGVAVSPNSGTLFIADYGNHRIRRALCNSSGCTTDTVAGNGTPGFAGDGGPAIAAQLNSPIGVALDGDDLYIADLLNQRIRQVHFTTPVIP